MSSYPAPCASGLQESLTSVPGMQGAANDVAGVSFAEAMLDLVQTLQRGGGQDRAQLRPLIMQATTELLNGHDDRISFVRKVRKALHHSCCHIQPSPRIHSLIRQVSRE